MFAIDIIEGRPKMKKARICLMMTAAILMVTATITMAGENMYSNTMFDGDTVDYLKSEAAGDTAEATTAEATTVDRTAKADDGPMIDNTMFDADTVAYLKSGDQAAARNTESATAGASKKYCDNTMFDADTQAYLMDVKDGREAPKRPITNWMKSVGLISVE